MKTTACWCYFLSGLLLVGLVPARLLAASASSGAALLQSDASIAENGNSSIPFPGADHGNDLIAQNAPTAKNGAENDDEMETPGNVGSEIEVIDEIGKESSRLRQELIKTKSILKLKQAQIAADVDSAGTLELFQHYLISAAYEMQSATYYIDGYPIYQELNIHGMKRADAPTKIYGQSVVPGKHTLALEVIFDRLEGLFSSALTFKVISKYTFTIRESERLQITAIASEDNSPSGKQQLNIKFDRKNKKE
jgi:hypothetical protein